MKFKEKVQKNKTLNEEKSDFSIDNKDILLFKGIIYVPDDINMKSLVLDKLHKNPIVYHPEYKKLITMLRNDFYWPNMKNEIAEYVSKCLEC